jgi:hypothetical protein
MIGRGDTAPHRAKSVLLALCMTSGLALHATPASAEGEDCAASAEQSQPLQRDGKLTAARRKLMACSRPECPAVVRNDCTKWLADLDAMMPTLVVRAVDAAGADVVGVRVFIDGERRDVAGSEGKEFEVDPGTHALRLEHDGDAPVEQTIVVRESERHRMVSATFGRAAAAPSAAPSTTASSPEAPTSGSGRSIVVPVVLMAAGGVALGVASALWVSGLGDRSSMEGDCAQSHTCPQSSIDSARGKLVAGDIVGGVGVVAAATGLGILLFGGGGGGGGGGDSRPVAVDVHPTPGGAQFSVQGRF